MPSAFETAFAAASGPLFTEFGETATWFHGEEEDTITIVLDEDAIVASADEVEVWSRDLSCLTRSAVRARDQIKTADNVVYTVADVIEFGGIYQATLER